MLRAVTTAFNDDGVLSVEAGTGTGKSLAYLVPAILWSRANQQRVVISTHTINLQEQLVTQGPAAAHRARRPRVPHVALVKGRGNYLCQRKAAQAEAQPAQLVEDELLAELRAGARRGRSRPATAASPISPCGRAPEVWEQVVSENDNCLRARCPYYSTCFFYSARRAAAAADILVVNHHLLMADLALRAEIGNYTQNGVLPPSGARRSSTRRTISRTSPPRYFGAQVSLAMIERACGRLQSRRNPARACCRRWRWRSSRSTIPATRRSRTAPRSGSTSACSPRCASASSPRPRDCFDVAARRRSRRCRGRNGDASATRSCASPRPCATRPSGVSSSSASTRLATALDAFAGDFDGVLERIARLSEDVDAADPLPRHRARRHRRPPARRSPTRCSAFAEDDARPLHLDRAAPARAAAAPALSLHRAPIAVGAAARARRSSSRFATAVLTSATLTVDGTLRLPAPAHRHRPRRRRPSACDTLRVESPFDFARQALLVVPADLPEPNAPGYDAASHAAMRRILAVTRGGTFLLFTSYGALNRAWFELANELRAGGYLPLRQGELSRHVLLRRFVADPRAVLFATDSFWEGVDVRGDALRCVVITRLPFRVPTEPLEQARVEAIAARGGDPFAEHTLPQAVIKLQAGLRTPDPQPHRPRLRRRSSTAASPRKRYGAGLLRSLPPAKRAIGATRDVLAEVEAFFASRRRRG